ncbi:MAG TPA: tyrosine-type recombinase/integrase, partial [Thermoanaerobaculia bacterium]|nr:tyrosine-type recombinase/integrase [Thermoanaerobaculia bacterium]
AVFPSLAERERYTVRTAAKTGKPLQSTCAQGLSLIVRERLADIGITGKQLGAHCLRATAATIAIAAGASLQEVRELMRHDWSSTTEGYVAWEQIRHANAQDRLNYRLPSAADGGDEDTATDGAKSETSAERGDTSHEGQRAAADRDDDAGHAQAREAA